MSKKGLEVNGMAKKSFVLFVVGLVSVGALGVGAYFGYHAGRAERPFTNSSASGILTSGGPTLSATRSVWRSSRASPGKTCG